MKASLIGSGTVPTSSFGGRRNRRGHGASAAVVLSMYEAGPIGGVGLSDINNTPGTNGLGRIQVGTLELSNVDLSREFADMIVVQRSFQAGSRVVTVSDSMLEEVINLKR